MSGKGFPNPALEPYTVNARIVVRATSALSAELEARTVLDELAAGGLIAGAIVSQAEPTAEVDLAWLNTRSL